MRGKWPYSYVRAPQMNKPIEEIWADLDGFTFEYFEDNGSLEKIDFFVPIPPFKYKGKFTKGLCMTQAGQYLLKTYPELKKIFHFGAYSMCSAYPWCEDADVFFVCYDNKQREEYYKKTHPGAENVICLPLQDADFTNEYQIMPAYNVEKEYDLICVATPYDVKNYPMIAQAIKCYEQKYGKILRCKFVFGLQDIKKDKKGKLDFSALSESSKSILNKVDEILDNNIGKYVDIIPHVQYSELSAEYSSAKCLVLASLVEGKNRALSEAMSCDVPIIVFDCFNKWARLGYPVFYGKSGEYAPEFTPESLAETIHKVITNYESYEPRKNYLIHNGRKNFVETCASRIPYYKENIPDYVDGNFVDNIWVNLACQTNYQRSFRDIIYDKSGELNWVRGIKNIDYLIRYYYFMFGINQNK